MQNIINQNNQINTETVNKTTDEQLLDNSTSYMELAQILRSFPEAALVAGIELKRKSIEIREEKRRLVLGEDYEESQEMKELDQKYRRPRWNQLDAGIGCHLIAKKEMAGDGFCAAYSNGYAVYYNGSRRAIMWIPEYLSESYTYFHLVSKAEKHYLSETETVDAEMMDNLEWFIPLMMHGEDVIAINLARPRNNSDMAGDDDELGEEEKVYKKSKSGGASSHIPNPEEAYMQKAEREAQLDALSDDERVAVILYHEYGYKQAEIAELMEVAQKSVSRYLSKAKEKMAEARRAFNEEE